MTTHLFFSQYQQVIISLCMLSVFNEVNHCSKEAGKFRLVVPFWFHKEVQKKNKGFSLPWRRGFRKEIRKGKVAQSCPALCYPMDYTVHGILQARMLEWVAFPFSRGPSQPRNLTQISQNCRQILYQLSYQASSKPITKDRQ